MTTFVDTSVLLTGQQAEDQDPVVVIVRSAQTMLREGLGESGSEIFEKKFAENYSSKNFSAIFDLLMGNAVVIFKKVAAAEDVDRVAAELRESGAKVEVIAGDASDRGVAAEMVRLADMAFGRIDVLVCCAGGSGGAVEPLPDGRVNRHKGFHQAQDLRSAQLQPRQWTATPL